MSLSPFVYGYDRDTLQNEGSGDGTRVSDDESRDDGETADDSSHSDDDGPGRSDEDSGATAEAAE